jgi:type II secretory ATPase GspE/PulE/Tfp pilus assembly ATPase PilB-like protein
MTVLDAIHRQAVTAGASDVHVEPLPVGGRIRQRVDGVLSETMRLPEDVLDPVVARIKLLAGIDVAERRTPQDGRYSIDAGTRSIDARVSSVPTLHGERIVIRILDAHACAPSLEELDMPPEVFGKYRRAIDAPYGFVVVCGPTGSGKTTTLYASLKRRNLEEQQLCTVEDPVEIRIAGVAQVQVNSKAGITFAGALRAFLRQDPDVVMVGEMRDRETAAVATGAALSGQLVLTTLHASDAARAVDRLADLGVARAVLGSALSGILSQRLVRKLCASCRRPQRPSSSEARRFGIASTTIVFESSGCSACRGTGFIGRTALFEYLAVDAAVRRSIAAQASPALLTECAEASGYRPMLEHGLHRALRGETSLRELRARAFGEDR